MQTTEELQALMARWQELTEGSPWALELEQTIDQDDYMVPMRSDPRNGVKRGRYTVMLRLLLFSPHTERRRLLLEARVYDPAETMRVMIEGVELNVAGALAGWGGPGTEWGGLPEAWEPFTNFRVGRAWEEWLWTRLR